MAKSSDHDDRDAHDDEPGDDDAGDAPSAQNDDDVDEAAAAKPKKSDKGTGKRAKGSRPALPDAAPRPQGGSLGKSLVLFLVIIAGLATAFAFFGQETSGSAPKWKVGDRSELEITLVANDVKELACASPDEVKGLHCAFEAATKTWSKGDAADDKTLLRPYTTTDRVQILAAGLWSQPALAPGKLPAVRFAVKCTYTVEGKIPKPGVRWSSEGAWLEQSDGWYAGTVSNCRVLNP